MKAIWAPWRMEYILGEASDGCFLCDAHTGTDDARHLVLRRGAHCYILMNRYPYNNGHLMIASNRHIGRLEDLTPAERAEMMELTNAAANALTAAIHPDGFNIGLNIGKVAGAGVADHIHIHVVPRWDGDTNFMPVLGETKVIPQALQELYGVLRTALGA